MGTEKGSEFERKICKDLSLWWTDAERDDIFYRTPQSGGRATTRAKKGQTTHNHNGDIMASDAIGMPLLQTFRFELKRGYSSCSIQDLLDSTKGVPQYADWIAKCQDAIGSEQGGEVLTWMIILRKDKKQSLCMFPCPAWHRLRSAGAFEDLPPKLEFSTSRISESIVVMRLADFLLSVTRRHVEASLNRSVNNSLRRK